MRRQRGVGARAWAGFSLVLAVVACGAARRASDHEPDGGAGPGAGSPSAGSDAGSTADRPPAPPPPADGPTDSLPLPPAEVVRYGMPANQAEFDRLVGQGYQLLWQDGYQLGGAVLFNQIYRLGNSAAWRALDDLTGDDLRTELAALSRDGFRPLQVDSYPASGGVRYAVVAQKSAGPEFVVYHAKNVDEHQRLFDERNAANWSPITISVTEVAGAPSVTSLYENRDVSGHYSWRALTPAAFEAEDRSMVAGGLRLVYAKAYTLAGEVRISAIWHGDVARGVTVRQGLSADQLGAELELQRRAGLRTRALSGYVLTGQPRFLAIWSE
jgi:hypothetical protein